MPEGGLRGFAEKYSELCSSVSSSGQRGPGLPWAGTEHPSCLQGVGRTWLPPDSQSGPPAPGHGLGLGIHFSFHVEDLLTRPQSDPIGQKLASHLHLLSSMVLALSLWETFFFKEFFLKAFEMIIEDKGCQGSGT